MSRAKMLAATTAALGILAIGSSALAQPGAYYAEPPPPAPPATAPTQPDLMQHRWGIGLRTVNMNVSNTAIEDDEGVDLEGAGLHIRYRLADNWRAELTIEGAESDTDAAVVRDSGMGSLSLQYIFNPYSNWNWYVLGGVGRVESTITTNAPNGASVEETFEESHLQLGLGVERVFSRVSIGAELRGAGLERDDSEGDGVNYAGQDGPVPMESAAGMFNIHATYYF